MQKLKFISQEFNHNQDYTTVHLGGSYRTLGCNRSNNILGVAPLDRGNTNKNDVAFAFTHLNSSVEVLYDYNRARNRSFIWT